MWCTAFWAIHNRAVFHLLVGVSYRCSDEDRWACGCRVWCRIRNMKSTTPYSAIHSSSNSTLIPISTLSHDCSQQKGSLSRDWFRDWTLVHNWIKYGLHLILHAVSCKFQWPGYFLIWEAKLTACRTRIRSCYRATKLATVQWVPCVTRGAVWISLAFAEYYKHQRCKVVTLS